jgi:3-oxoacyl-[acyl-carrier protein] reductase
MRLEGRVALVTGGGGGLGQAISAVFAEEGAAVVVNDIRGEAAEAVAGSCRAVSPASAALVADVGDSDAVTAMFGQIRERWGRLDVLVNNAGVSALAGGPGPGGPGPGGPGPGGPGPGGPGPGGPGPGGSVSARLGSGAQVPAGPNPPSILDIADDTWHRMLRVHLDGTFFCTRAAVRLMAGAGGGSIVCISSIAGLAGIGPLHYSTAKGGILGFVRSLARQVGPMGIRINAICPGAIDAGMTKLHDRAEVDAYLPSVPLGRLGTAEEIGRAALYLASDDSSYTTGQWLSPNGGSVIL